MFFKVFSVFPAVFKVVFFKFSFRITKKKKKKKKVTGFFCPSKVHLLGII